MFSKLFGIFAPVRSCSERSPITNSSENSECVLSVRTTPQNPQAQPTSTPLSAVSPKPSPPVVKESFTASSRIFNTSERASSSSTVSMSTGSPPSAECSVRPTQPLNDVKNSQILPQQESPEKPVEMLRSFSCLEILHEGEWNEPIPAFKVSQCRQVASMEFVDIDEKKFKSSPARARNGGPIRANCNMWSADGITLISGSAHPSLATMIAENLGIRLTECRIGGKGPLEETHLEIMSSVRGKHVVIVQSASFEVNTHLMEMLQMVYTCKTFAAAMITVVAPVLPYSRGCRPAGTRTCVPLKMIADIMQKAGVKRLISLDLFRKEIQGFFSIPIENLRSFVFLIDYVKINFPNNDKLVVVARGPDVMQMAVSYAERLNCKYITMGGDPRVPADGSDCPAGEPSRSPIYNMYSRLPPMPNKVKVPLHCSGKVKGCTAILVDDMIGHVGYLCAAAKVLKRKGATAVHVLAVHGCFPANSKDPIDQSAIDSIIVTNSVNATGMGPCSSKVLTVDISILMAEAIRRVHYNESMDSLYKD